MSDMIPDFPDAGAENDHLRQRIAELEAENAELRAKLEVVKDTHQAILNLYGSEGMTDAKFVKWVLLALGKEARGDG